MEIENYFRKSRAVFIRISQTPPISEKKKEIAEKRILVRKVKWNKEKGAKRRAMRKQKTISERGRAKRGERRGREGKRRRD